MNITSYAVNDNEIPLYHGKLSIAFDYSIINADSGIYRYLGTNSSRAFNTLLHPDDLSAFYECINHLSNGTQHLTFRLVNLSGNYRFLYATMDKNISSIDMELVDIVNNHQKYDILRSAVAKCKKFMNYSENIYFEYFYNTRIINIFSYMNERSIIHFNQNIDTLYDTIITGTQYTTRQKREFCLLHDSLLEGTDNISLTIDGRLFGFDKCILDLRGGIQYKDGKKLLFAAVVQKIESGEPSYPDEKYYHSSHATDPATGVYNKRAISELATDVLASSDGKRCYMVMLDIDNFKNINDTYGHIVGDEVITKTAEILKRFVGERGYVGRFGGDEFFFITDKIFTEDELTLLLKTARKNLLWDCKDLVPDFDITTSLGISCYPDDAKTYDELLLIADKCLYLAKAKGKNRYIIYRPELHGDIEKIKSNQALSLNPLHADNYQLCSAATAILQNISDPNVSLIRCLSHIRQDFAIEGISIYTGARFTRSMTSGTYPAPLTDASFLADEAGHDLFDANGLVCVNKLLGIKAKWVTAYDALSAQGSLCAFFIKDNEIAIGYDLFSKTRKWSDIEKGLLLMIARTLIARIRTES